MQGQTSSYVLTTLLAKPWSQCLTTLANVKDELDIESDDNENDARLRRFIVEESAAIARTCNRVFGLATWQDEFRPQHGVRGDGVRANLNPLKLSRWPLVSAGISFAGNTHSNLLIDRISSTAGLLAGMPVFGPGIPSGAAIKSVAPYSIMLSSAATATASGISLTAGLNVVETVVGNSTTLVAGTDFQAETGSLLPGDEGTARLYRLNQQGNPRTWPAAKIVVVYQAGYVLPDCETPCDWAPRLPSDLETACIRLVVWRFNAKNRDPTLVQRDQPNLGSERYWVGAVPGQTGPYPNEIMSVLENYRQPVLA